MGKISLVTSSFQKLEPKYSFQEKLQVPKNNAFLGTNF
jgi:hypothetical protein